MLYNLNFKGYWRDSHRSGIPATSGIYLVYKCTYNSTTDEVSLIELLYIGKAEELQERHSNHDKREIFLKECDNSKGETLCYSIAEVNKNDLDIVENALIFAQKPKLNDKCKDKFNYDDAEFHLEGRCALMKHADFIITKKNGK
jgi:excinuclease UvrABC nuclease subunit